MYYDDGYLTSANTHIHTHSYTQHLRTTVTLTALLKVHLTLCSVICRSQKYRSVSCLLTWQRRNDPLCTQEALFCSDTALTPCKKTHLFKFCYDLYVSIMKWIVLLMCVLDLVPDDICVVTTTETWAGDFPTCIHTEIFTALLRVEASQTGFFHHL